MQGWQNKQKTKTVLTEIILLSNQIIYDLASALISEQLTVNLLQGKSPKGNLELSIGVLLKVYNADSS